MRMAPTRNRSEFLRERSCAHAINSRMKTNGGLCLSVRGLNEDTREIHGTCLGATSE
jgi:hypothetical protein